MISSLFSNSSLPNNAFNTDFLTIQRTMDSLGIDQIYFNWDVSVHDSENLIFPIMDHTI